MVELATIALLVAIALGAAWIVNVFVTLMSGEHPHDTRSVWLDILIGDFRGVREVIAEFQPRWLRWIVGAVLLTVVFAILFVLL